MLDVTTNNQTNINPNAGSAMDELMDPLFDNDWLHEHNLDILFDLFEEEIERKEMEHHAPVSHQQSSASIFGSSPFTSYLFGSSPSLVSALDLYDVLYFDNQPASAGPSSTTSSSSPSPSSSTSPNHATSSNTTLVVSNNNNNNSSRTNKTSTYNVSATSAHKQLPLKNQLASSHGVSANHITNSITNAMRIKRRNKKGHNEGTSLLARPFNNSNNGCANDKSNHININSNSIVNNTKIDSDKTSTKVTNLKKPISNYNFSSGGSCSRNDNTYSTNRSYCGGNPIDINQNSNNKQRNKHLHHYHHHVHYITGCSIIREHAYAVRGH